MAFSQIVTIRRLANSNRSKAKQYKHQKDKKLPFNSRLQTYQILTDDDQMLILCLSYSITTVIFSYSFYATNI